MLVRIVTRLARFSPPEHHELVRGMVAELDSIADPTERARFALGAIAAIARLTLIGIVRATLHRSTLDLLLRHATPFAVSFASLTALFLTNDAGRWARQLSARGAPNGTLVEVLVLALPHTVALTIPMAVFIAVSWVFTRLGAEGVVASERRRRSGVLRLIVPVLGATSIVAAANLVSNAEVLPRANARLMEALAGAPVGPTDRTMTMDELREAAQAARATQGVEAAVRAAQLEVEIHKKLATAAACVVFALAAAASALRFPLGGMKLVWAASSVVFVVYYLLMIAGESLADRGLLSPFVGMWMGNACILAVSLLLFRPPSRPGPEARVESLAIGG